MEFLPMPHHVTHGDGCFQVKWNTAINLTNTEPSALLYAQMLQAAVKEFAGLQLQILRGEAHPDEITLCPDASLPADTYTLRVDPEGVTVRGGSDEAILHGVMTLRQWVQRHGALLPAIAIEDAPDMANRGYYLDCSRGRIPTLDSLKKTADLLCQYKINQWQLYVEHTYMFRNLSEAWREDTPLTAQDIMELDAYCRARHIELVPSLSSFGHMYQILSTKTCEQFCEMEHPKEQPFTYTYWGDHHTLNVSNPGTMDFIKSLISEYRALFTSNKFNICCDETFDLGKGRSKKLAEEKGEHALYMAHVVELCRWLLAQGVTPMFWGDIMWRHPEAYAEIPEGVICLNWGYLPNQRENEIRDLAQMGATQYACPGVGTWNQLVPLLRSGFSNNQVMCQHAHKYHAIGMLNTDWGDYGHVCQPAFSIPGILYGAAFAWNANGMTYEEVNDAVSLLAFGDATGDFMRAFDALSCHEVFNWFHVVRWIEEKDAEKRHAIYNDENLHLEKLESANAEVDAALAQLHAAALHMDSSKRGIIEDLALAAEGIKLINNLGCYVCAVEEHRPYAHRNGSELASALESWYHAYVANWRRVSRESTLVRTRSLICAWPAYLRG